jgi:hypothetical protein
MSRVSSMLKFSNEQALAMQQAFAPSGPMLVAPPSMQPSTPPVFVVAPAADPSSPATAVPPRLLLVAYLAVALALGLCDLLRPRAMLPVATAVGPVLSVTLAAHAASASGSACCLGLACALLYPAPLLLGSEIGTWAYCALLGLFLSLSPTKAFVRPGVWACMTGLALTSGLLALGVRGHTLWGPVVTLLCMQATLTLWIRPPLRLVLHAAP